ncbi:MAG: hypothetical protein M3O20_15845 [Acidobacteriota bacterium]|nr:hypothetical protein [Acidobacteriota bacterium]
MKTKVLAIMLLAGGMVFAQPRFAVGIGFNQAPAGYATNIPPCPGPGYTWMNGYWHAPAVRTGFGFAPRSDNHFRDADERGRGAERGRDFDGHDRGFRSR